MQLYAVMLVLVASLTATEVWPPATGGGIVVMKNGSQLKVKSWEQAGRLIKIISLSDDYQVIKTDLVDVERSERLTEALTERLDKERARTLELLAERDKPKLDTDEELRKLARRRPRRRGTFTIAPVGGRTVPGSSADGSSSDTDAPGRDRRTLLMFDASWCGYCRKMKSSVLTQRTVRAKLRGYRLRIIDIDESPKLAERYGVSGVPTFVVLDASGGEARRTTGFMPASAFASWL